MGKNRKKGPIWFPYGRRALVQGTPLSLPPSCSFFVTMEARPTHRLSFLSFLKNLGVGTNPRWGNKVIAERTGQKFSSYRLSAIYRWKSTGEMMRLGKLENGEEGGGGGVACGLRETHTTPSLQLVLAPGWPNRWGPQTGQHRSPRRPPGRLWGTV